MQKVLLKYPFVLPLFFFGMIVLIVTLFSQGLTGVAKATNVLGWRSF